MAAIDTDEPGQIWWIEGRAWEDARAPVGRGHSAVLQRQRFTAIRFACGGEDLSRAGYILMIVSVTP